MSRVYDSDEERFFHYWLIELKEAGYIDSINANPDTYRLLDNVEVTRISKLKTKDKKETFALTKKREYTPDFLFTFTDKARGLFFHDGYGGYDQRPFFYLYNNEGLNVAMVDVKGGFTSNLNSSITFPDRQSMMLSILGWYVQKVIPYSNKPKQETLFKSTFTPQKMIDELIYTTNKVGKWKKGDSKIKWKVIKLKEYVKYKIMD